MRLHIEHLGRLARRVLLYSAAFLIVVSVRLMLTLSNYQTLRRWYPDKACKRPHPAMCVRIAHAVTSVSRLVPGATCLTQAAAAQIMLGARGFKSEIEIGVRTEEGGRFAAHAWLVTDGAIILGGTPEDLATFKRLTTLTVA